MYMCVCVCVCVCVCLKFEVHTFLPASLFHRFIRPSATSFFSPESTKSRENLLP